MGACLHILHSWDYDLESVRQHWERIIRLKPLPLVDSERWSRADSYALEQIIDWFDDDWECVAVDALTDKSVAEIKERKLWLKSQKQHYQPVIDTSVHQERVPLNRGEE